MSAQQQSLPLCVDMDGTLIRTDLLWESLMQLLKRSPWRIFCVILWILKGRAYFKQQVAACAKPDVTVLPYHLPFIDFLKKEREAGRKLLLVTAADREIAGLVAQHVGIFDEVIASDGTHNLKGGNKAGRLTERFGVRGFDYAGNSTVDLPVWKESSAAIVVNADEQLVTRARAVTEVAQVFNDPKPGLMVYLKALRVHQWVKNLIIFIPLITSHKLTDMSYLMAAVIAFLAFSFCASGIYVLNDLGDLDADRHHHSKQKRPFAAGLLSIPCGLFLAGMALAAGLAVAVALPWKFIVVLAVYLVLTTSYSARLKQLPLVDVFILAGLYTIRLVAGHAATGIVYSSWLLAFSMFIFLSLALVKRYTELITLRSNNQQNTKGRGYVTGDLELVAMLGVSTGCLSVMVMTLYVSSVEVRALYKQPALLMLICPLLLYWISRVWLIAHRGAMQDDPIVFAIKDRVSHLIGLLTLGIIMVASR